MAIFSAYIAVENWQENRGRSYLFIFFGIVAIFMFFFKRSFRKKIEEQNRK
jgi:preprotein translocase subunit YajC